MDGKQQEQAALHRWAVIAEAANGKLTARERGALVRQIAARAHAHPDGSSRVYSRGTIDRWLRAWRAGGLGALRPGERSDTGIVRAHPELFAEASALRLELPGRSAAQIASILFHRHGVRVADRTVRGQLRRAGLHREALAAEPRAYGRYEAAAANERWITDVLVGPWVPFPKREGSARARLFLIVDDHSRLLVGARVRLLATGASNKNDPNDARSVAVAALRSATRRDVRAEDYTTVLKVWAKRHRDLGRARNQVACRLHAVLCGLIPGGVAKEISAAHAARILEQVTPSDPVAQARCELAADFLTDLRRLDDQLRESKKKLAVVVTASGTTLTGIFGVGPVIAATVIGDVADVSRFTSRDRFAAYNGTAPVEMSSGNRKIYRLSRRGNRRINHALHMAAITQIRQRHSDGRAYYDKKIAEGKTHKEALRSLKRRISDVVYARLHADARQAAQASGTGPGGQPGNGSASSAAGSHPERRLFGQATPEPATTLRPPAPPRRPALPRPMVKKTRQTS